MAGITVKALDHVVLTVKNIEATVAFYTKQLGMQHETFVSKGDERSARLSSYVCYTHPC